MIFFLFKISLIPFVYSFVDLDTSFTNHRYTAADINGWKFVYELYSNNAVSVQGLTQNRNVDLERSECLTSDGSCADPNAVQYVGLGILGEFAGVYKTFENLPPHCQIYFSADMAIKGKFVSISKLLVSIDTLPALVYTVNPVNDDLFYEMTTLQGVYSHSYPFLLINFQSGFFITTKSYGIRNIQIKYTPCPPGCLICSIMEVQVQCSQWILNYQGLGFNNKYFSNDGWQITNSKKLFKTLPQDVNQISYAYCLFQGLGPITQNQDVQINLFLDPHYEVRYVLLLVNMQVDTRFPPLILVKIDGLEVSSFSVKSLDFQINFCQWESYDRQVRKQQKLAQRLDFNQKSSKRKINFSLIIQTFTVPIIYDQIILKDFQVYIKKCYSEPNFICDECVGPEKNDCNQKSKVVNFQQIAANDFSAGQGWQVILPELGGILTCNGRNYFGLDSTKVTNSYIQKFFTINDPHSEIEISFIIYKIDKYISDKFQIYLDDILIDEILFSTIDNQYSFCGTNDNDGQLLYTKKIVHSRTFSLIQIKSTQTTSDGIFGIFNFKLKIKNGQESKDLYFDLSTNPNFSSNQWNQWVVTKFSNVLNQFVCDSTVTLLGKLKPEMQIRRFFQNIVSHTQIRIQFTIFLFTSAFHGKIITLILNNQTVWEQTIIWYNQKVCNDNLDTFVVNGNILLDHDLDYAFFVWSSNVQDINASWGITDFKLFIS